MKYSESYRVISDRVAFLSAFESQMIFGMQIIFLFLTSYRILVP